LGLPLQDQQSHPAAVAVQSVGIPELVKPLPAVRRFYSRTKSMKIQNDETKQKLTQRLRRIEGQVRGVQTMLDEERDCREIMQQLTAIYSAVQSTSRVFFRDYAAVCLVEIDDQVQPEPGSALQAKLEKMVQEMITLLDKTP
jgi:DNA-binding FrmR family transcriptional regulator